MFSRAGSDFTEYCRFREESWRERVIGSGLCFYLIHVKALSVCRLQWVFASQFPTSVACRIGKFFDTLLKLGMKCYIDVALCWLISW